MTTELLIRTLAPVVGVGVRLAVTVAELVMPGWLVTVAVAGTSVGVARGEFMAGFVGSGVNVGGIVAVAGDTNPEVGCGVREGSGVAASTVNRAADVDVACNGDTRGLIGLAVLDGLFAAPSGVTGTAVSCGDAVCESEIPGAGASGAAGVAIAFTSAIVVWVSTLAGCMEFAIIWRV